MPSFNLTSRPRRLLSLLILAVGLLGLNGPGLAREALQQVGEWMAHYYEHPDPGKLPAWVKDAATAGAFDKPTARFPLMIFISRLIQDNPERGLPWCRELSALPAAHKAYLGWAFRNAGSPVQEECIGKILGLDEADRQKVLGARLHDPLARNPEHPGDLDMLWATFMATGAELPVERIIEVLGLPDPVQGAPDSVRILLLKGAARWSLSANIRQHRRAAEIAEARRTQASGQLRQTLDEILAETRNPP